jgi:hypothetical protein
MSLTPGQLTTPHAARAFLLGGHAVVTLVSKKTGTRFTYRVSAVPGPSRVNSPPEHAFFVSVLSGPENTADYAYIGLWKPEERRFFRTAKSRVKSDDAPSFAAFAWMLRALFGMCQALRQGSPGVLVACLAHVNADGTCPMVHAHVTDGPMPAELEVWHQGSCGKCGRPLTVPESIASGIGPVCASK